MKYSRVDPRISKFQTRGENKRGSRRARRRIRWNAEKTKGSASV